jgi:spore maturation protein CgeB
MRRVKLLCLCSALDLKYRYGCTPAWWQLFKGLYEEGHEIIAIPYQGAAVESPWWRVCPNPCEWESKAFTAAKKWFGGGSATIKEGPVGAVSKTLIESWVQPRWEGALRETLQREKNVAAVIAFSIPVNHFTGIATTIKKSFDVPFFYYDGDVPASLPRFGGFASGFKIYEDASLDEYDGVFCNSEGGAEDLKALGAKTVTAIHWGVDPALYEPLDVRISRDVFFYGFGSEYREDWMEAMLSLPSVAMPEKVFEIGGDGFKVDLKKTKSIGDVPFSVFRQTCCASRINLNITRGAHATVRASSSMRPFELAAMGCCIVSNPVAGLDTWFEIGKELVVVNSTDEAIATYRRLLNDDAERSRLGQAARARVLAEHTHRHRARQLANTISTIRG